MTGPHACDGPLPALRGHVDDLGAALEAWSARDDTRPCPDARRAANDAVDAVDTMLQALHAIRARLITEMHQSDAATAARVDALLAARNPDDFPGPAGPGETRGRAL